MAVSVTIHRNFKGGTFMDNKDFLSLAVFEKNLTEAERVEWQAIYASYKSGSVISGTVLGVDLHEFNYVPEGKKKAVPKTVRCLILIKYRVKVIIPETEVFDTELDTGYHILHSMCGANINYVITHIDADAGFAVASRKFALERMRYANYKGRIMEGQVVDVDIISVGKGICTVSYRGYDMALPQREVCYNNISDLREILKPGDVRKAIIKKYDAEKGILRISIKEMTPHPFDGVETRHPVKSTRVAHIVGKYAGGVYCRLCDGITDVLCSYLSMEYDGDYKIGDKVEIVIRRHNFEKKMIYGKIIRKISTK